MKRALVGVLGLVTVLEVWLATRCMSVHRSFADAVSIALAEVWAPLMVLLPTAALAGYRLARGETKNV